MNRDEQYKQYVDLYKKLRKNLNLDRVSLDGEFEKALLLTFKDNYKVLINPQEDPDIEKDRPVVYLDGMLMIYDPGFENVNKIISNQEVPSEYKMLLAIIKSFSLKANSKYYDMMPYPLKKDLEKTFKLSLNADKEYFLFGSDELRQRYHHKHLKTIKQNQKVKIKDSSAILITHEGKRYVDISSSFYYMDKKFIYKDNVCKRVKVNNRKDATITCSDGENYSYYKEVLKDGVNLSEVKNKLRYHKINGKEFILVKQKGEFLLKDKKGLIHISHPDLLVYLF